MLVYLWFPPPTPLIKSRRTTVSINTYTSPASLCSAPPPTAARPCRQSTHPWRTLAGVPAPPSTPLLASATITITVAAAAVAASAVPRLLTSPPTPHRLRQPPTAPLLHQFRKLLRTGRWCRCLALRGRLLASHRTPPQQTSRQQAAVVGPHPYLRVGIAAQRRMERHVGDEFDVPWIIWIFNCALLYLRETPRRTFCFGHVLRSMRFPVSDRGALNTCETKKKVKLQRKKLNN